jgi:1-acyl-sn-glycerol-3-phosphate acyltransferase
LVLLLTALFGSLATLMAIAIGPRLASFCGVVWARLLTWATPVLVTCIGREHLAPGRSYVVVSNHQSQYDILLLYGWLGVDFKWVMKQDLRRVPFLGYACEKIGHIYINRSDHTEALASLEAAKRKITGGTSVVFFPEGTRSRTGELQRFKKGAFRMALDLGLPILPISLAGTRAILPTRTLDLFPGRVSLIMHPPIETDGATAADLPRLMEQTAAAIRSGLQGA